jgi:hypothetical protein
MVVGTSQWLPSPAVEFADLLDAPTSLADSPAANQFARLVFLPIHAEMQFLGDGASL